MFENNILIQITFWVQFSSNVCFLTKLLEIDVTSFRRLENSIKTEGINHLFYFPIAIFQREKIISTSLRKYMFRISDLKWCF